MDTKKKKRKKKCGRPSEDFSCHPRFLKQEYFFFFWPECNML